MDAPPAWALPLLRSPPEREGDAVVRWHEGRTPYAGPLADGVAQGRAARTLVAVPVP